MRVIDISNKDGKLWAEDAGYLSDFAEESGYLFSIGVDKDCQIFYKDYAKAKNVFKGKYYITLDDSYDGELFCTNDYDMHIDHNVTENDYFGDYVRRDYEATIILDMDNMSVLERNEENDIEICIRHKAQEQKEWEQHCNSFRQPY